MILIKVERVYQSREGLLNSRPSSSWWIRLSFSFGISMQNSLWECLCWLSFYLYLISDLFVIWVGHRWLQWLLLDSLSLLLFQDKKMVLANAQSNSIVSFRLIYRHIHNSAWWLMISAAQACNFDGDQVCEVHAFHWTKETIYALPTLLFSFECHGTMLPIYCDLRRKEPI